MKMNLKCFVYIAVVFFIVMKLSRSQSVSECRGVDKTWFPICVKDGFTSTSVYLANDFYGERYSTIINNIEAKLGSCSKYTSFILCSLYVPRCEENMAGPRLPCREVCEEFVQGCWDQMNSNGLNWLKPLCSLLPTNVTDANCLKPSEFKPSTKPLPSLYCNKTVSNKECNKVECKTTFVPAKTQGQFQNNLTTIMEKLSNSVKSDWCKETLRKLACASYTPPCDGNSIQTLCKDRCTLLFDDCPEAFNITEVSSYCAEPAEGNTSSGFCELTRWPSARHWHKGESPWTLPFSFPAGLIAILVLVPLFAIGFIYGAVLVRRRYEQKKGGYVQQQSTYTEPQTESDNNLPV